MHNAGDPAVDGLAVFDISAGQDMTTAEEQLEAHFFELRQSLESFHAHALGLLAAAASSGSARIPRKAPSDREHQGKPEGFGDDAPEAEAAAPASPDEDHGASVDTWKEMEVAPVQSEGAREVVPTQSEEPHASICTWNLQEGAGSVVDDSYYDTRPEQGEESPKQPQQEQQWPPSLNNFEPAPPPSQPPPPALPGMLPAEAAAYPPPRVSKEPMPPVGQPPQVMGCLEVSGNFTGETRSSTGRLDEEEARCVPGAADRSLAQKFRWQRSESLEFVQNDDDDEDEEEEEEEALSERGEPGLGSEETGPAGEKAARAPLEKEEKRGGYAPLFPNPEDMKEKVRQAVFEQDKSMMSHYKQTGLAQWLVKHVAFEYGTLAVIAINAIWISIDLDLNKAKVPTEAPIGFQIVDNLFCAFFVFEITVRFLAYERKRMCLFDYWFVFDASLVLLTVVDTWVMSLFILLHSGSESAPGGSSVLRILRLMRLTRMGRMMRILRAVPELMILMKGMATAARSVILTLVLLTIIIYVFAIFLRGVTEGTELEERYFSSVPASMLSLLTRGVLPDQADLIEDGGAEHIGLGVVLLVFVLLASLTVMNMLIGILVQVVSIVATVEREEMTVRTVKRNMQHLLERNDVDANKDRCISRQEFERLLTIPEAAKQIQEVGVDVVGLVDYADFIFGEGTKTLSFQEFFELLLQLRGRNTATVKDIVDLRKCIFQISSGREKGEKHGEGTTEDSRALMMRKGGTVHFGQGNRVLAGSAYEVKEDGAAKRSKALQLRDTANSMLAAQTATAPPPDSYSATAPPPAKKVHLPALDMEAVRNPGAVDKWETYSV